MPFTLSHVVAILPLARAPLAPAALAIGAMTPDIPYFLPVNVDRDFSHSLAGVPTIDLLVGLATFVVWIAVLRAPALDYGPAWLRERLGDEARWRVNGPVLSWLLVIVALELGILSHLFLDLFTHEGGWLETIAPITSERVGTFAIANIVHATVSIIGAFVIALWTREWARRTPRVPHASRLRAGERLAAWIGLAAVMAAVGLFWWGGGIAAGRHPLNPNLLGSSFFIAGAVAAALTLALALLWRVRKVV